MCEDCHVFHEKRGVKKKKGKGKKEVLPAISTRILCSEQNIARVTITLVVNGSTGWFYIYISKIRKEATSIEIGKETRLENLFSN